MVAISYRLVLSILFLFFFLLYTTDALPRMVDIWSVHISLLTELGYHVVMEAGTTGSTPLPKVVCHICPHLFPRLKEAYRLTVTEKEVSSFTVVIIQVSTSTEVSETVMCT